MVKVSSIPAGDASHKPTDDAPDQIQLVLALPYGVSFPRVGDQLCLHPQGSKRDVHLDALGHGDTIMSAVAATGGGLLLLPYLVSRCPCSLLSTVKV